MKRKFLILTLCFTIIFSSINYKKTYAFDGGVISAPMLATILTLGVSAGFVITSDDDVQDIGRLFYEKYKNTWEQTKLAFDVCVTLGANKVVTVSGDFLKMVLDFYNDITSDVDVPSNKINFNSLGIPHFVTYDSFNHYWKYGSTSYVGDVSSNSDFKVGNVSFEYVSKDKYYRYYNIYFVDTFITKTGITMDADSFKVAIVDINNKLYLGLGYIGLSQWNNISISSSSISSALDIPYVPGSYSSDELNKDSVDVYVPGNTSDLIGRLPSDVTSNPTYDLPVGGVVTVPSVDNPSIDVDNSISFPNVGDIPDVDVPDVDVPGQDTIVPSFPSFGDSLDFSPMYLTNVTEKFPFSLPWDIGRLIQKFDVEPIAPIFDVPIVSETITLDLTEFSELASIVRFFVLICFILSLIFISTKLLG